MQDTDLYGANLEGVRSGHVKGEPASLPEGWFKVKGYLIGPGANLSGSNLQGANLERTNLNIASLYSSNLKESNLTNADLQGALLMGADLTGANLTGANLTGANLERADLKGADLTRADLSGTNLMRVDFTGATLEDLKGSNYYEDSNVDDVLDIKLNSKELIFEDVDKNDDGIISREEFQIFIENVD